MLITSLSDIVGGRLETFPIMKFLVFCSKFLQNSSTMQKISVTLSYVIMLLCKYKYLNARYLDINIY
jgi:hypothetical protein